MDISLKSGGLRVLFQVKKIEKVRNPSDTDVRSMACGEIGLDSENWDLASRTHAHPRESGLGSRRFFLPGFFHDIDEVLTDFSSDHSCSVSRVIFALR